MSDCERGSPASDYVLGISGRYLDLFKIVTPGVGLWMLGHGCPADGKAQLIAVSDAIYKALVCNGAGTAATPFAEFVRANGEQKADRVSAFCAVLMQCSLYKRESQDPTPVFLPHDEKREYVKAALDEALEPARKIVREKEWKRVDSILRHAGI